jgi:hypothetical protein
MDPASPAGVSAAERATCATRGLSIGDYLVTRLGLEPGTQRLRVSPDVIGKLRTVV